MKTIYIVTTVVLLIFLGDGQLFLFLVFYLISGVNISLYPGIVLEFRGFLEKFLQVMKKMPLLREKRQKSRFPDLFGKNFGKVSSKLQKSFDFHEKYLPLFNITRNLFFFSKHDFELHFHSQFSFTVMLREYTQS